MDPRKLLYFATVIEQGSLAKAAKQLAVSQPALSKSMDRLESELGMELLHRSAAGVAPTAAGELLYAHARQIREEMTLADARIRQATKAAPDVITIGTLPSLASSVVPSAVGRWKVDHPDVLLRVFENVQVELLHGLLRGQFDFVVGQTEFYDFWDGLKQRVLFRDRLQVFARRAHPLARKATLSWSDLARFPWVSPMVGGAYRTTLERILAAEGVHLPRQLIECGSIDFTKALVASSDHLAMLPAHAVMTDALLGTKVGTKFGAINPLPITVPELRRDIAVIFRARAPLVAAARALVAQIQSIGTELAREAGNGVRT